MIETSLLLLVGGAAATGAVAGHLPGIASWLSSKLSAGKAEAAKAVTVAEHAFLHPIETVKSADHAMALKAIDVAANAIAYLGDHSALLAQKAAIDAVIAAKNDGLAKAQAKIQTVLQAPQ